MNYVTVALMNYVTVTYSEREALTVCHALHALSERVRQSVDGLIQTLPEGDASWAAIREAEKVIAEALQNTQRSLSKIQ